MEFSCPRCGTLVRIAGNQTGKTGKCPNCAEIFDAPQPSTDPLAPFTPPAGESGVLFCGQCGAKNRENNYLCVQCGSPLHEEKPAVVVDPLGAMIPYNNKPAVISYYLGVFSLAPCLGFPLAIAAIIYGVIGLRRYRENPEVRGRTHSLVGLIVGSLVLLVYAALLIGGVLTSMFQP